MKTECVISGTTGGLMDPNYSYKISWSLTRLIIKLAGLTYKSMFFFSCRWHISLLYSISSAYPSHQAPDKGSNGNIWPVLTPQLYWSVNWSRVFSSGVISLWTEALSDFRMPSLSLSQVVTLKLSATKQNSLRLKTHCTADSLVFTRNVSGYFLGIFRVFYPAFIVKKYCLDKTW